MQPARMRRQLDAAQWLLLWAFLIPACHAQSAPAPTRVITDADKGATVQMQAGDTLELRLQANPTTGYMWYICPQSTPLLKLIGQSQTQSTEPGVGRPVVQIFTFTARGSGDGVLLLHYVRSWEKHSTDEKQFSLHVTIQ